MRPWMAVLALAPFGCSLVNEPDLSFLDVDASFPGDGDVDADVDGDVDGDVDADSDADSDAYPELCAGDGAGNDEDRDDLVDCADPDCFGDPICCPRLGTIVDEDFEPDWDTGEWVPFVEGEPPASSEELRIDFTTGNGLFARERIDMSYGLHAELVLSPRGAVDAGACESLAGCTDHVGLALTPVASYTPGVELPAILQVSVTAAGEILVLRGGRVRQRLVSGWAAGARVEVSIDVLPGGQDGQRGFRVIVGPTEDSEAQFEVWDPVDLELDETANLGADGMRGAWLALVGRTENEGFTTVRAEAAFLGCDNPAVFVPTDDDPLSAASFELGSWALGSFGSPAVAVSGQDELRLLFDAADQDLGLERYAFVPRAIGEANLAEGEWSVVPDPIFGTSPPSADRSSAREPAMLADDEATAWMATSPADAIGAYAIAASGRLGGNWSDPFPILSPIDVPDLTALRAPAVARIADDADPSRYHLWFVGIGAGETGLWHTTGDINLEPGSIEPPVLVLPEAEVGAAASRGLSEPIVAWDPARRIFLIWVLGEDALGRRTLHHGIAPESGEGIELYEGNPVLDAQDPILGSCDAGCTLHGGTTFVRNGRRAFLFARSAGTEAAVHEIVTVTQELGGDR